MKIHIKKLIRDLETPFLSKNSAVYCFCDNCHNLWELSLETFNKFVANGSLGDLDYLDNPREFCKKYYFVFKFCKRCLDLDALDSSDKKLCLMLVREISDLRELVKMGIESIDSQPDDPSDIINLN